MKKSQRKGHITCIRGRYLREAAAVREIISTGAKNKWCYLILQVTDGPTQAEIQEDWWEQTVDCRSALVVGLKIMGIDGDPFIRSERHGCIAVDNAMFSDHGKLRRPLAASKGVPSTDSHLWHFAGGIVFPGEMIPKSNRPAFCEYNAETRKGFVVVACDAYSVPGKIFNSLQMAYQGFDQFLQDVKVFKPGEYDWLLSNW